MSGAQPGTKNGCGLGHSYNPSIAVQTQSWGWNTAQQFRAHTVLAQDPSFISSIHNPWQLQGLPHPLLAFLFMCTKTHNKNNKLGGGGPRL